MHAVIFGVAAVVYGLGVLGIFAEFGAALGVAFIVSVATLNSFTR